MPQKRPDLRPHPYNMLTQGSIFTCAVAEKYSNCEVHGLVITARCDIAQKKYPVLNYLPIVFLKDWLQRDGLEILIEDARSDLFGQLKAAMSQAKISPELLRSVNLKTIAEVHFPEGQGTKAQRALSNRFNEIVTLIDELEELNSSGSPMRVSNWLQEHRPRKIEDLVRRLFKHQVNGYYFLERISLEHDRAQGFVALLREPNSISRLVSDKIGKGLEEASYDALTRGSNRLLSGLCITRDNMAMPISIVGSPTVEHILQTFASLFGRIGINDPDEDEVREVLGFVSGA